MKNLQKYGLSLLLCLALVGCDATKDFLGLTQETPDAFTVMEHAPLEMPPEFNLRPPAPGANRPQEVTPTQIAQKHVFSHVNQAAPQSVPAKTKATQQVLQQARTEMRQDNIRHVIHKENRETTAANQTFMQKLSLAGSAAPSGDVIDPAEESARLKAEGLL